jgi:hypothetical protein
MLPFVRGMHIPSHTGHDPHERRRAKMEAKTQANANSLANDSNSGGSSQNLIVRVKRLRTQDPVESMCIIEENESRDEDLSQAPHKRRHLKASANKLSNAFDGADLLGNGLGLNNNNNNNNNRLLLTRIGTVAKDDDADKLDTDTFSLNKRGRESDDIKQISNKNNDEFNRDSCLWITNGKKSVKNNEDLDSSYVIVDLSQVSVIGNIKNEKKISSEKPIILSDTDKLALAMKESKDMLLASSSFKNSNNDVNSSSNKTKISILDPTNRKLDTAIKIGFETGDFTDMAAAFTIGSNINYQRPDPSGHTCLMVAVMHGNVRMVKRLISKGADTMIPDSNGKIAWDYLKDANLLQSITLTVSKDIALLLHNATLKRHGHGGEDSYRRMETREICMFNNCNNDINLTPQADVDESYVIDVFVISKTKQESNITNNNSKEEDSVDNEGFEIINNNPELEEMETIEGVDTKIYPTSSSSSSQLMKPHVVDAFTGPIVPIEGLKIHGDGNVEIVYAYDSDWSDLGDDEDYDSNDERYLGNDYPEDEDSDDANRINLSDEDDSDVDDSDDDIDNGRMPRFEKKSVGRVLRHGITDDPFEPLSRDKHRLQQLWGLNNDVDDEDLPIRNQRERIEGMKLKSGMDFASVPREFGINGLPKYGNELSDDDIDEELLRQAFDDAEDGDRRKNNKQFPAWSKQAQSTSNGETFQGQGQGYGEDRHMSYNHIMPSNTHKPPRNTVAFDSELDMEDDDDDF